MARRLAKTGNAAYDERGFFTRLANDPGRGVPAGLGNLFAAEHRYELASWKLLWMLSWRLTVVVWLLATFSGGSLLALAVKAYLFIPVTVLASRFLLRWSLTPWPLAKLLRGRSPFLRLVRNGGTTALFTKRSWYRVAFPWE